MSNHTSTIASIARNLTDVFHTMAIAQADGTITGTDGRLFGTWSVDGDTCTIVENGHFYAAPTGTTRTTYTGRVGGLMTNQGREYRDLEGNLLPW